MHAMGLKGCPYTISNTSIIFTPTYIHHLHILLKFVVGIEIIVKQLCNLRWGIIVTTNTTKMKD